MAPEPRFRYLAAGVFAAVLVAASATPARALRLVDWNILNYPGTTGAARDPYYRTVLAPLGVDVLVTEETNSQAGVNEFLNSLNTMEPGQWAAAPFVDGNDTDAGLFSLPRRLGVAGALIVSRLLHGAMLACLLALVYALQLGPISQVGIGVVAVLLIYEHRLVKANDLSRVNAAFFTINGYVSVLFFLFWAADIFYASRF